MKLLSATKLVQTTLISLIFVASSCKHESPPFRETIIHTDESIAENVSSIATNNARLAVQKVFEAYILAIKQADINPKFYDSFALTDENKVSAYVYWSTHSESILRIFKSPSSQFIVTGSYFPAQMIMACNGDLRYLSNHYKAKDIHTYDTAIDAVIVLDSRFVYFEGFTEYSDYDFVVEANTKFFTMNERTLVFLTGVKLICTDFKNDTVGFQYLSKDGIAILSGSRVLDSLIVNAEYAGETFATSEIQRLFLKSEYFREVLADDRLRPLAEKILVRRNHSLENQKYEYSLAEFLHDKNTIREKMDSFRIKIKADDFFLDVESKIRTGTLLWFYESYRGFMVQWIVLNTLCLIGVFILKKLNKLDYFGRKAAFAFIWGAVNKFCFDNRPRGIDLKYAILPFLLVALIFVLLFFKKTAKTGA
ncbi:MAG TPA: hypothetical protein VK543_04690 [Puia sp.]|nr:hypothetical protein [Puia sp.]